MRKFTTSFTPRLMTIPLIRYSRRVSTGIPGTARVAAASVILVSKVLATATGCRSSSSIFKLA